MLPVIAYAPFHACKSTWDTSELDSLGREPTPPPRRARVPADTGQLVYIGVDFHETYHRSLGPYPVALRRRDLRDRSFHSRSRLRLGAERMDEVRPEPRVRRRGHRDDP